MTNEDLLKACKVSLNISASNAALEGVLSQKILVVKGYLKGAGVSEEAMDSDLAVGIVVLGVGDLWNIQSGETKFSPIFHTFATQLACKSL